MAPPPDYDVEIMPLITESNDNDNSRMCRQLMHWLDENNFGDRDSVSVNTLKDALAQTVSRATSENSGTPSFSHNKVHHPFWYLVHLCRYILTLDIWLQCLEHGMTVRELLTDFRTYLVGIVLIIAISIIEIAFLFNQPAVGIIFALCVQATLVMNLLLLAVYWWGRGGAPLPGCKNSNTKDTTADVARAGM